MRLNAPGTLQPGIVCGIARRRIVADREEGVAIVARHVGVLTSRLPNPLSRAGKQFHLVNNVANRPIRVHVWRKGFRPNGRQRRQQ